MKSVIACVDNLLLLGPAAVGTVVQVALRELVG